MSELRPLTCFVKTKDCTPSLDCKEGIYIWQLRFWLDDDGQIRFDADQVKPTKKEISRESHLWNLCDNAKSLFCGIEQPQFEYHDTDDETKERIRCLFITTGI